MRLSILLFGICWILGLPGGVFAQKDSTRLTDTGKQQLARSMKIPLDSSSHVMKAIADSLVVKEAINPKDSVSLLVFQPDQPRNPYERILHNPFIPQNTPSANGWILFREKAGKENVFYLIAGILLLLAIIRVIFPRYLNNLFVYFFQSSRRQNQTKDRLLQEQLSSLLLNLLFFLISATFITLAA
ncbi:MAG: hypothetical protein FGM61_12525, partial [Sediminibacterium sp.]|nr:hypothetical protein [Sediminibacterium sp.]